MVTKKQSNGLTDGNRRTAFRLSPEMYKRLHAQMQKEAKVTAYPLTIVAVARKCIEIGLTQLEKK